MSVDAQSETTELPPPIPLEGSSDITFQIHEGGLDMLHGGRTLAKYHWGSHWPDYIKDFTPFEEGEECRDRGLCHDRVVGNHDHLLLVHLKKDDPLGVIRGVDGRDPDMLWELTLPRTTIVEILKAGNELWRMNECASVYDENDVAFGYAFGPAGDDEAEFGFLAAGATFDREDNDNGGAEGSDSTENACDFDGYSALYLDPVSQEWMLRVFDSETKTFLPPRPFHPDEMKDVVIDLPLTQMYSGDRNLRLNQWVCAGVYPHSVGEEQKEDGECSEDGDDEEK